MTAVLLHYGDLAPEAQTAFRILYALLLLAQLLLTLPQWRRFFTSERHGGYVVSSAWTDRVHSPPVVAAAMGLWIAAGLCLLFDWNTLAAAAVNAVIGRYLFVTMRWRSILRGMGAPGHMNMWIGTVILLLELSRVIDTNGIFRATVVSGARVDFALIIISAGIYKIAAGYARNDGFQRGLVNPWWGFFSTHLRKLPEDHIGFRLLNHLGYLSEVVGGTLFLVPGLAVYAAFAFGASFIVLGALIRLGFLAEMIAACAFLYVQAGDPVARLLSRTFAAPAGVPVDPTRGLITTGLCLAVGLYVLLLPPAYAGMSANFYGRRRLPPVLQTALDRWVMLWGLMLWRVFTRDLIEFHVGISVVQSDRTERAYWGMRPFEIKSGFRYMHVGEFICLASIFTTLKYYPADRKLFEERLLRYARTVPAAAGEHIAFDYYFIVAEGRRFRDVHAARFMVDPVAGIVAETTIDPRYDIRTAASGSPVRAGTRPGTYAPAK
ncbi:MAG: hypothetical protein NVSMB64_00360 [Candidatus Velthaea sp.]